MTARKEIWIIGASLVLLAALILNWGYNVYQTKITSLKAEANVLFFESLEATKERMFLKKTITVRQPKDRNVDVSWLDSDTSTLSTISMDDDNPFPAKLVQENLAGFVPDSMIFSINTDDALEVIFENSIGNLMDSLALHTDVKVSNFSMTMDDDHGSIRMTSDTIFIVDFDSTQNYLAQIFEEKLDQNKLKQLKAQIIEFNDSTTLDSLQYVFVTNPGKIGDFVFGRKTYTAALQNFAPIALQKMIPEILFGLFIYTLIAGAFLIIYRNLQTQRKLIQIKDDFVSNITHELKTPISVVNVAIEALQNFGADQDPEKTKRYLDVSKKEINRLSGLVDKVLHLSTHPSDQAPTEKFDIGILMAQVVDAMKVRLTQSPITIQMDSTSEPIWMEANPSQIKSVIYNLIDNAVKYSTKGNIHVNLESTDKDMIITIADQGIGIPHAYQAKIFDQFFRVPSNDLHNVKGYGLGLHNVKQIVEQYNGTIDLKSTEGIGTAFTIKWPKNHG